MQMMSTDRVTGSHELFGPAVVRQPHGSPSAWQRLPRDEQFLCMLGRFRSSGGLARVHDVASLFTRQSGLNIGSLAKWIVDGEVVHFDWHADIWLPMFQFGCPDLTPRAGVAKVLTELHGVFDPWEIAQWFAGPSAALGNRTPADAMALDPDLVLHAARCDRYVVDA